MAAAKPERDTSLAKEWLRARADVAEAADRWAKAYVAAHELSRPEDIVDALAEAFEAGAAEVRKANR
jgi:hypothetical protein